MILRACFDVVKARPYSFGVSFGREEKMKKTASTQRLAISGMVIALYIVIMYITQGFAFGQYQVRIATSLYAVAYLFPFLTVPLGLANMLSNLLMGGLGILDMIGGGVVGLLTAGCCALIRKKNWDYRLVLLPVTLIVGLGIPVYLSGLLNVPYWTLALSLLVGQAICGVVGVILVSALKRAGLISK